MVGEEVLGGFVLGVFDEDEAPDFPAELTVEVGEEKDDEGNLNEEVVLDAVESDEGMLELRV